MAIDPEREGLADHGTAPAPVTDPAEALRQREAHFDQLISGIADYAIFLLDPDGRVKTWNKGAERIKGYLPHEIIGKHFGVFYTPEDQAASLPEAVLRTAGETGRFEADAWRVRKDGSRFFANVVVDALRTDDGHLHGFVKITRDMTERRAMEQQLAHAQKMEAVGQLTGGVAHDFNNILTIVMGNLDIIQRERGDAARVAEAAERATAAARRAANLTRQLLAFSRRQALDPKPVDANSVVTSAVALIRPSLGEQISIETSLAAGLWLCELDVNQIQSALLNLAINARDAMPDGGKLIIETANCEVDEAHQAGFDDDIALGHYVLIAVTDTGTGMPKDVAQHVFEPFFTTKPIGEGTGLGLSQVYGFVRQSGGLSGCTAKSGTARRSGCTSRNSRASRRRRRKRKHLRQRCSAEPKRFFSSKTIPACAATASPRCASSGSMSSRHTTAMPRWMSCIGVPTSICFSPTSACRVSTGASSLNRRASCGRNCRSSSRRDTPATRC